MGPLVVIADLVVTARDGIVLLPAVPRRGLPVIAGDTIEIFSERTGREEVLLLGLEPEKSDPSRVRLRIAGSCRVSPGMEVWPGENQSRVVLKPQGSTPVVPSNGAGAAAAGGARRGALGRRGSERRQKK